MVWAMYFFSGFAVLLIAVERSTNAASWADLTQGIYGPDSPIEIELGLITCQPASIFGDCSACAPPGACDNFACSNITARAYIVPQGAVTGTSQVDLDALAVATPTVILQGTSTSGFFDLQIGVTGPTDATGLGNGMYDVVFDECEDGMFDPGQDSIVASFEVEGVAVGPCVPHWDNAIGQPGMNTAQTTLGVYSLEVFNGDLIAGGQFTTAGGVEANYIARWNGTSWFPLGSGLNSGPFDFAVFDDGSGTALYAGGTLTIAGGVPVNRIAKWNGTTWLPIQTGFDDNATIRALAVFDDGLGKGPALYAAGRFSLAGGSEASNIAKWDGTSWYPVGAGLSGFTGGAASRYVFSLAVFDDGSGDALYAGGGFSFAGETTVNGIARWDGEAWRALGSGMTGGGGMHFQVQALAAFDDGTGNALYAGGHFHTAGGVPAFGIAKWDGKEWLALGGGVSHAVSALSVFDDGTGPALYAGGGFNSAGGKPANCIAKWDGITWTSLGSGISSSGSPSASVKSLAAIHDGSGANQLIAGGWFGVADNDPASKIAAWQGCHPFDSEPGSENPPEQTTICLSPIDQNCMQLALEVGKKYLVLVTHGWQPWWLPAESTPAVMQDIADEIAQRIEADVNLDSTEWQVVALDWSNYASTTHPSDARLNAKTIGKELAAVVAEHDYEYVHMIAHSAGCAMIARAAQLLGGTNPDYASPGTQIMCTFLDPYGPCSLGFGWMGENTTWSDCYYVSRHSVIPIVDPIGPLLNLAISPVGQSCFDVDVTNLDIDQMNSCTRCLGINSCPSTHSWPVDFYRASIGGNYPEAEGTGHELSFEGGNHIPDPDDPGSGNRVWNVEYLENNYSLKTQTGCLDKLTVGQHPCENPIVGEPAYANSTVPYILPNNPSPDCPPTVPSDGLYALLTTCPQGVVAGAVESAPSWINFLVDLEDTVHQISVDVEFTSPAGAEGLLSLYLDGQLLLSVDERYVEGIETIHTGVPSSFQGGTHTLSLRLDSFSGVPSSVTVSAPTIWTAELTPPVLCPADFVTSATFQPPGDGQVDGADLAFLLGEWGDVAKGGSPADIVTSATFQPPPDGLVDGADLAVLLGAWGVCE